MSCTDCGGGTPQHWKRCEGCSYKRLRVLMSPEPISVSPPARRWSKGDRIVLADGRKGRVARCPQGDDYVIGLDGGGRAYVNVTELQDDAEQAKDPAAR